ncbi:transcriptional regulator, TetR family [Geomicrobium sp. JCM 19037]|uniref:TetR/AcrR family transcriptional regulator n=1 Tax=Geomicrobium sp. JCM 19037 TaxID=1460634 RepID=UPI00045F107D|nr:TetR-like C-terminal domain-containing protein [Geomicrobium sp. JCM 19037]GAK02985.1 transcriptional regulator, TetR family [Geomicrobium sp. JCM 19037]
MTPRRGLTSKDIVNSAAKIANQNGLSYVSISVVAQDLDIKPPSLYNHIRGLDELHELLAIHSCLLLYQKLQLATHNQSNREALTSFSYAYIDFARAYPGQYEAATHSYDEHHVQLKELQDQIINLVRTPLYELGFEEEYTVHLVRMLRSLLHGFVMLESAQGFKMDYQINDSLDVMIETFLIGIQLAKQ